MLSIQNYNTSNYNYQPQRNFAPSFKHNNYNYQPYSTPQNQNNGENLGKTAVTAGLLQLVASSLDKVSGWLGNKLVNGQEFTNEENVRKVVHDMCKKHKLNIDINLVTPEGLPSLLNKYGTKHGPGFVNELANELTVVADGKNAFYHDGYKFAVAPKTKPSLLPHEIGHAVNAKNSFLKVLQKSRRYAVFAPVAALIASRSIPPSKDGKPNFIERNAGVLGFCAFLPTIIEEGLASLRGIRQAGKTLGKNVKLGALKRNYALAWGTYLLAGIGLGIGTKYAIVEDKLRNGI